MPARGWPSRSTKTPPKFSWDLANAVTLHVPGLILERASHARPRYSFEHDSGEQHPPGPAPNLHFQYKFVGARLLVEVVGWILNDGVMFTSCANATVAVRWLGLPLL